MEDDRIAMATAFSLVSPRLHPLALLTDEQSSKVTKYLNGSTRMGGLGTRGDH